MAPRLLVPRPIRFGLAAVVLVWVGCGQDPPVPDPIPPTYVDFLQVPEGWTLPEFPEDNGFTDVRWALGRALFFDPRLSIDGAVSCATCHIPERAFSAPEPVTPGALGAVGERNAATLTNAVYQPHFMSEGGVPTLEMQVLVPLQEPSEMAHNIVTVCEELAEDYAIQSEAAYGRELDPFVMTRALATFQRSLLSGDAPWDRWQRGEPVAAEVEAGAALFGGEGLGATGATHRPSSPPTASPTTASRRSRWTRAGGVSPASRRTAGPSRFPRCATSASPRPTCTMGGSPHWRRWWTTMPRAAPAMPIRIPLAPFTLSSAERTELLAFLSALNDTAFVLDARWQP